jgi:hypothetical protein
MVCAGKAQSIHNQILPDAFIADERLAFGTRILLVFHLLIASAAPPNA